jgi:hypothetical protein
MVSIFPVVLVVVLVDRLPGEGGEEVGGELDGGLRGGQWQLLYYHLPEPSHSRTVIWESVHDSVQNHEALVTLHLSAAMVITAASVAMS